MGNYNWQKESGNLKRKKIYRTDNKKNEGGFYSWNSDNHDHKRRKHNTTCVVTNTIADLRCSAPMSYASRPQNIRPSALIRTFDIEDLFDL